jgi:hypothetical protein
MEMAVMRKFIWMAVGMVAAPTGGFAEDYSAMRVVESAVIQKMMSGPGLSGTIMSPDGKRVIHVDGREVCLYDVKSTAEWAEGGCVPGDKELGIAETEEFQWSPDSTAVLFPTYANVFERLRDGDIGIFDATTQRVRLLTGDGVFDIEDGTSGFADVAAQWLDADTIVFLRYPLTGKRLLGSPVQIATIERDGTGLTLLAEFDRQTTGLIDSLAVSPEGTQLAFHAYSKVDTEAGVWQLDVGGADETVRLVAGSALPGPVQGLAYSPDGQKLLMISSINGYPFGTVLDLTTGATVAVSSEEIGGLGWSPTGHALVYTTTDRQRDGKDLGVYIAPEPGEVGYRVLEGKFYPAACCYLRAMPWAANDRLVFLDPENYGGALSVQLGR